VRFSEKPARAELAIALRALTLKQAARSPRFFL